MSRVLITLAFLGSAFAGNAEALARGGECEGGGSGVFIGAGCARQDSLAGGSGNTIEVGPETSGASGTAPRCQYAYDWTFDPAAPDADPTINLSGRRQDFYASVPGNPGDCAGYLWIDSADPASAPVVTAADLLPGVWVSVQRQLPRPIPRIAPADWDPDGYTFVQHPTFFWVDQAPGQWAPVTGSASASGITVSVQATPVRLVVSTGDGHEVVCEGAPPAYRHGAGSNPYDFRGCAHTYRDSSAMADNGETFPVALTIVWEASWTATTGEGGSLGTRETTSETRWLPVAEIQAVLVDGGT